MVLDAKLFPFDSVVILEPLLRNREGLLSEGRAEGEAHKTPIYSNAIRSPEPDYFYLIHFRDRHNLASESFPANTVRLSDCLAVFPDTREVESKVVQNFTDR